VIALASLAALDVLRPPVSNDEPMVFLAQPVPATTTPSSSPFISGPVVVEDSDQAHSAPRSDKEPVTDQHKPDPADRAPATPVTLQRIAQIESWPVDTAIPELLPMLEHPEPVIRRAAVEALGDLSTNAVVPVLVAAAADDDPSVRVAVLDGLAAHEDPMAVAAVESYLHDKDKAVRLAAIEALTEFESRSAVHTLASLLSDQDPVIRRYTAASMGDIGGQHATMYLDQARYDPDAGVRANADSALSELAYDNAH
jgi:HEAT repeat protein